MPLTAEQAQALEAETDAIVEETTSDAPASGEQPTTEQPAETETETPADAPVEEEKNEAEGDKPADEKKPDEKAKAEAAEKAKSWAAVEVAKKEQLKVARARQELENDVARVRAYEGQLNTREKSLDSRSKDLDTREQRVSRLEEAIRSKDLDALIDLGFDYEAATRRRLEDLDPAARVARLERDIRERDANEKAAREKAEKDAREKASADAAIAETRAVAKQLVELVEQCADEFPDLYLWSADKIAEHGIVYRDAFYAKHKRMPDYDTTMKALQRVAKKESDAAEAKRTTLQQRRSGTTRDAGSAGKVDPRPNSGAANTPALTNRTATERTSVPREESEADVDAECLGMLRGLKR